MPGADVAMAIVYQKIGHESVQLAYKQLSVRPLSFSLRQVSIDLLPLD